MEIKANSKWSKEHTELLIQHYPNTKMPALIEMLGRTQWQIYFKVKRLKLKKSPEYMQAQRKEEGERLKKVGAKTRFANGNKTWNKGKTGYMGANSGSFKKGNVSHNTKPLGSTRRDKDKAIQVKVYEGNGNSNYVRLSHLVWEQHNGKIPKGMVVAFKDRNVDNTSIENLELVTRAEMMKRNHFHRLPQSLKSIIFVIRKLNKKIRKYEKQNPRP